MKYKYQINIWWSKVDKCYIAEMPELPGCMADGTTPEEAVKNIELLLKNGLKLQNH